ncbi:PorV/PorQ family protein [candidate division KSB1 bacterium]|nr:PorV/PorQ family protein [candidate division KSB1 bacterium]
MQKKLFTIRVSLIAGVIGMLFSGHATAQDYNEVLDYFFLGRQPSAKAEAMGKAMVATENDAFSSFYNPAAINKNQGLTASTSYATPYYAAKDAYYLFTGVTNNWGTRSAFGLSIFHFSFGTPITITNETNPNLVGTGITPTVSMYTLTLATRLIHNVHAGINWSYIRDKSNYDGRTFPRDIGLFETLHFGENQELNFGASLYNFSNANLKYTIFDQYEIDEAVPQALHLGTSYQLNWGTSTFNYKTIKTYGIAWHVEYVDLLNSAYHSGFRTGAEFSFMEMFAMRVGYYKEDRNDYGYPESNKDNMSDFTYGIGISLPIEGLVDPKSTLKAKLDLVKMKQPTATKNFDNWDNFSVYNLSLNWRLKN